MPFNVLMAVVDARLEHEDEKVRLALTMQRWQTWVTIKPHIKESSLKTPESLLRFAWERKQVERKPLSESELKRKIEKYNKLIKT